MIPRQQLKCPLYSLLSITALVPFLQIGVIVYQAVAGEAGINSTASVITACSSYLNLKLTQMSTIQIISFAMQIVACLFTIGCLVLLIVGFVAFYKKGKEIELIETEGNPLQKAQKLEKSPSFPDVSNYDSYFTHCKIILAYVLYSCALLAQLVHFGLSLSLLISLKNCLGVTSITIAKIVIVALSGVALLMLLACWVILSGPRRQIHKYLTDNQQICEPMPIKSHANDEQTYGQNNNMNTLYPLHGEHDEPDNYLNTNKSNLENGEHFRLHQVNSSYNFESQYYNGEENWKSKGQTSDHYNPNADAYNNRQMPIKKFNYIHEEGLKKREPTPKFLEEKQIYPTGSNDVLFNRKNQFEKEEELMLQANRNKQQSKSVLRKINNLDSPSNRNHFSNYINEHSSPGDKRNQQYFKSPKKTEEHKFQSPLEKLEHDDEALRRKKMNKLQSEEEARKQEGHKKMLKRDPLQEKEGLHQRSTQGLNERVNLYKNEANDEVNSFAEQERNLKPAKKKQKGMLIDYIRNKYVD